MMSSHPAAMPIDALLAECKVTRKRRSGPGGQRRNKVETAVVIEHVPTGIRAEASERRSQEANHRVAVFRLRVRLAVAIRANQLASDVPPVEETAPRLPSLLWRSRCRGGRLAINPSHDDFPALLAEALDVLERRGSQLPEAAERLGISSSQLVRLLRHEPAALARVNAMRSELGLRPLR